MTRPHPWEATHPAGLRWDFTPPGGTLPDITVRAAASFGDRAFLDYRGFSIGFADFAGRVNAAAAGFLALGLPAGARVALFLPNTPYFPLAFFAALKAGLVVVTLSPMDAERELAHKLADSGARVIVTSNIGPLCPMAQRLLAGGHLDSIIMGDDAAFGAVPHFAPQPVPVPVGNIHVLRFETLEAARLPAAWPELDPDSIAVLTYTGGTTGVPKAAMHSHATLLAAAGIYEQFYGAQMADDGPTRVIAVLPLFHIYALSVILVWQTQAGATLLLHPRFDAQAVLHDIEVKRATYFPGVPTMWIALSAVPGIATRDFSSLRRVSSGGAPLPPDVSETFERMTGQKLGGGWGMTETAAAGTGHLLEGLFTRASAGLPLPGFAVRIVGLDDPHRELNIGETGEISVAGPNVFKGYWNKPEETARGFMDGWFMTGDIGRLDADGMLHVVDRKKDMIISGGFNVYPRVIEDAIYEHPDVQECCVIGVADAYRGQSAKAFIKLRDGAAEFSLDALNAFLADKIGRHERPVALEFRAALPRTAVGKLSKKELIAEQEQAHGSKSFA